MILFSFVLDPQLECLEKLTGLANDLLQDGDYEIYQATFEKLTHILKVFNILSKGG